MFPTRSTYKRSLGKIYRKVFLAYPAILKYLDEYDNLKVVSDEDVKKMKDEMAKDS